MSKSRHRSSAGSRHRGAGNKTNSSSGDNWSATTDSRGRNAATKRWPRKTAVRPLGRGTEIDVVGLGGRGDGIARLESGEVVLVAGGVPGDRLRVHIERSEHNDRGDRGDRGGRGKQIRRGAIASIVRPSPDRVDPPCAVAEVCGGCSWQHVSPSRQRLEKTRNAARAIGMEPKGLGVEQSVGWRRRARFHLRRNDGVLRGGFMAKASDVLVTTERCVVLQPPLDTLPERVARWAAPWLMRGEGLAHLGAEGVVLRVQGKACGPVPQLTNADATLLGVVGLEVVVDAAHRRWGDTDVTLAETVDADPIRVDAGGFSQASAEANRAIRQAVGAALDIIGPVDGGREFFAGSGNLTGLLLRAAPRVTTLEQDTAATDRAKGSYGDADGRLTIQTGDASEPGGPPIGREVWLLDPGRPGAKTTCERIADLRPAAVVYVSCASDTLRRDLVPLKRAGFVMTHAWWVDTFPHTPHMELIVLLRSGDASSQQDSKPTDSETRAL